MTSRLTKALAAAVLAIATVAGLAPTAGAGDVGTLPERIAGPDRYATAALLSSGTFPSGSPTVVVTTGENWPDAISAGPFAAINNAPLLLAARSGVPAVTLTELKRLHPNKIFLIGGVESMPAAVEQTLNGVAPVTRIAGADRYQTAALVAKVGWVDAHRPADVALFVNGADDQFAFALGAAAYAAGGGFPLLLTTLGQPPELAVQDVIALKSFAFVIMPPEPAKGVAIALADGTLGNVSPLGFDRPEDAMVELAKLRDPGAKPTAIAFLTTLKDFPDALAVSALARQDVRVLPATTCITQGVRSALSALGSPRLIIVGGPNAVPPAIDTLTPCAT